MKITVDGIGYEVTYGRALQIEDIHELAGLSSTTPVWLVTREANIPILDGSILVDDGAKFVTSIAKN